MVIIKRDGSEMEFNSEKIKTAIKKANNSVEKDDKILDPDINYIANEIEDKLSKSEYVHNVEDIQNMVEEYLFEKDKFKLAKNYITYRYLHNLNRDNNEFLDITETILNHKNEEIEEENANKNPSIISTQRDYIAGEVSKMYCKSRIYPADIIKAHNDGLIHIHDLDYVAMKTYNCSLVNIDDMLQNGTIISGSYISKPKSFTTACNITTQIMAQVASQQYGGQTVNVHHISKFVDVSRQKFIKQLEKEFEETGITVTKAQFDKIIEDLVAEEIKKGVQMIQYQINTLQTTNGQAPFASLFIYFNEAEPGRDREDLVLVSKEILKQRIKGIQNKVGAWVAPSFPKILYVLDTSNCNENTPYWEVTKLAAECTSKRMVPDYISEKVMKELKDENVFGCMGCRSFLSVWKDSEGNPKFWGRFNKGVVTINLPDVAMTIMDKYGKNAIDNEKAINEFWNLLDERLEICHRALLIRAHYLEGTSSDVAPILWQDGALARLKPHETIDKLLKGGYSTISLGYVGIYETVKALTGKSNTDPSIHNFALSIVKYLNNKCTEWNNIPDENYGFSLYGTPEESLTYKFSKALIKRHGKIDGITDKLYIVNSYHVDPRENIDAFNKLKFESEFQKYTTGGAISYIETPNLINNQEAILSVIKFIYDNIWYAELNCKLDYCQKCGYDGEIKLDKNEHNKWIWKCPNCENTDINSMNIVRRVCGYLSNANAMNQGRKDEIAQRVLHL